MKPKITVLPGHIQSVYVQNTIKLYACIIKRVEEEGEEDGAEAVKQIGEMLQEKLPLFIQSSDLEVQERVGIGFCYITYMTCTIVYTAMILLAYMQFTENCLTFILVLLLPE